MGTAHTSSSHYLETEPLRYQLWFNISKGQAVAYPVTVSTACGEANQFPVKVDCFVAKTIAGNIIVKGEIGKANVACLSKTLPDTTHTNKFPTGIDKAFHAGFDTTDFFGKFTAPGTIRLFHSK